MVEQIELLQRGLSRFAYSSFISTERVEGSVLLDFFVTFFIKKESLEISKTVRKLFVKYVNSMKYFNYLPFKIAVK